MTSPAPGITALSASQAEEFDPEQVGGCPRRWYVHRVERVPLPEPERSKEDGDAGHALFATHYRGQPLPKRARMLKAVHGALATGRLPVGGPDLLVESRFDGQPARDANGERLPLRHSSTLWLGGVPWDGYVDLRFYRAGMITVLDHKFSSDIHTYAKTDLLSTVQMPVYALDSLRIWPEAQHVELVHNYVSRRGVDSLYVRQLVSVEQVRQRGEEIAGLVQRMQEAARAPSAEDVPGNRASCHTWSGCPFQSRCSAFKEKPKMELNDEELSWLNVVGGGEATPAKAAGPVGEPAPLPEFLKEKAEIEERTGVPANALPLTPGERAAAELVGRMDAAADRAGVLDPADEDPFAVFAPVASVPQEQPVERALRGAGISAGPENPFVTAGTQPTASGGTPSKCPDCPHPAHAGAACTGKRGRGACRCGAQGAVEVLENTKLGHLPTCVQNDAGKWLCMEGCTASRPAVTEKEFAAAVRGEAPGPLTRKEVVEHASEPTGASAVAAMLRREQEMHRRTLGELEASERGLKAARTELERLRDLEQRVGGVGLPPTGWTGTLRVEVNLGPETLALLQRLLGVKP